MNRPMRRFVVLCLLISCGIPSFSAGSAPDSLLQTMQRELKRANTLLAKSEPPPYYLSYAVTDIDGSVIAAANGSLMISASYRRRLADVMMRVGSPALDNTHSNKNRPSGITSGSLPLNNDPDAIARVLWQLTNRGYDQASSAFLTVKTNTAAIGRRR
jgi:TldD protein